MVSNATKNMSITNIDSDMLTQIIESSPVPTFVIDVSHRVTHWNHACEVITGVPSGDIIGTSKTWRVFYVEERPVMADLILDGRIEDIKLFYEGKYQRSAILEEVWEAEDFFPHFPPSGKWLAFSARALNDKDGRIVGAIETLRDTTEQKMSERSFLDSQHLLTQIIEGCPVPLFVLGKDHKVTYWNRACESIIGTLHSDIIGTKNQWKAFYANERPVLADLVLSNKSSELSDYYNGIWAKSPLIKDAWEATDYFPHFKDGAKWLYFTAAPIHDNESNIIGAVETLQDVTSQKEYEEKLKHQANHDSLTGLANRSLLYDRLNQAIAHADREGRILSILFIDLDDFKTVNDTLGHNAGDQIIREAAKSISKCIRPMDTVARLGGDEFIVLLFAPDNADHATNIVRRISKELAKTYMIDGRELYVGSSVGVAMYPQDGKDVNTLMMNADSAMYQAKAENKGGFRFFTQDMNDRANQRLKIENNLRKAIEEQQFELVYQPIYDLKTGHITAAEALLRWNHPEHGVIAPRDFIQIAEETGLIIEIGNWVLETAMREACFWIKELDISIRLSVNVSARQFHNNEIHDSLTKMFNEIDESLLDVELELTENLVMLNPAKAQASLVALRNLGVKLVMDDFGTGYSSLAYLRRFPFNMIKIDKAFIQDLGTNLEAEAIVRAVLNLGRVLGLRMLAEGVETEDQRAFLEEEGCDEVQGFLFSHPLDVEAFRSIVAFRSVEVKSGNMYNI